MATKAEEIQQEAAETLRGKKKIAACIEKMNDGSRLERQHAADVVDAMAKSKPSAIAEYIPQIVDVLERPEAKTRWKALDALTELIDTDSRACEKAVQGAENALFDEGSGPLRLAAMRFLCKLGSTTEKRSEKVWPFIDEAIQIYHGDVEYQDMLIAVIDFSSGKLDKNVSKELASRMKFDADNGKGWLKKRATQIEENLKK